MSYTDSPPTHTWRHEASYVALHCLQANNNNNNSQGIIPYCPSVEERKLHVVLHLCVNLHFLLPHYHI